MHWKFRTLILIIGVAALTTSLGNAEYPRTFYGPSDNVPAAFLKRAAGIWETRSPTSPERYVMLPGRDDKKGSMTVARVDFEGDVREPYVNYTMISLIDAGTQQELTIDIDGEVNDLVLVRPQAHTVKVGLPAKVLAERAVHLLESTELNVAIASNDDGQLSRSELVGVHSRLDEVEALTPQQLAVLKQEGISGIVIGSPEPVEVPESPPVVAAQAPFRQGPNLVIGDEPENTPETFKSFLADATNPPMPTADTHVADVPSADVTDEDVAGPKAANQTAGANEPVPGGPAASSNPNLESGGCAAGGAASWWMLIILAGYAALLVPRKNGVEN